ncbi:MAG: hypothetical protein AAGC55_00845 [Myxococcota bacterium]
MVLFIALSLSSSAAGEWALQARFRYCTTSGANSLLATVKAFFRSAYLYENQYNSIDFDMLSTSLHGEGNSLQNPFRP